MGAVMRTASVAHKEHARPPRAVQDLLDLHKLVVMEIVDPIRRLPMAMDMMRMA